MDGDSIASLFYLGILVTVIGGWFFASNTQNLSQTVQTFLIWGLIFLGFIAAYGMWDTIQDNFQSERVTSDGESIIIPRGRNGHFSVVLEANGVPIDFLIDTGATSIVLNMEDAESVGLDPDNLAFLGTSNTANGVVSTARARLDSLQLEDITKRNVMVSVNGGELDISLLGMEFLSTFSKIEMTDQSLRLIH